MEQERLLSIIFYILIAAITCVLAHNIAAPTDINGYSSRIRAKNRLFLAAIFVILFLVSALRFAIGNDYRTYVMTAHEAGIGGYVVTEAGFNLLVRAVYTALDGEYYEVVFAVFAMFTLIIFLKGIKRQAVSFFDTFFLFMMLGVYFQTFNTVRYYLALSVAFYAMRYVKEKDWLKLIFVVVLASFFHKSVLIVIPVYFIASFRWRGWQVALGFILSALCYLLKDRMLLLALYIYPSYQDTIYLEGGTSLISVLRIAAVLFLYGLFLIYYKRKNPDFDINGEWVRQMRFYGQLNMAAFVTSTFFSFLPVVTRLVYYFSINQILLIPLIISKIEDKRLKKALRVFIGIAAVFYFLLFLKGAHKDGIGLLPYKTWLFSTERYTFK